MALYEVDPTKGHFRVLLFTWGILRRFRGGVASLSSSKSQHFGQSHPFRVPYAFPVSLWQLIQTTCMYGGCALCRDRMIARPSGVNGATLGPQNSPMKL